MLRKTLLLALLPVAGTWITPPAIAQERPFFSQGARPLLDRLDNLGRKILGIPTRPNTPSPSRDSQATEGTAVTSRRPVGSSSLRAGSVVGPSTARTFPQPRVGAAGPSAVGSAQRSTHPQPETQSFARPQRQAINMPTSDGAAGSSGSASPSRGRLYERLQLFRESLFSGSPQRPKAGSGGETSWTRDPSAPAGGQVFQPGSGAGGSSDTTTGPPLVPRRSAVAPRVGSQHTLRQTVPTLADDNVRHPGEPVGSESTGSRSAAGGADAVRGSDEPAPVAARSGDLRPAASGDLRRAAAAGPSKAGLALANQRAAIQPSGSLPTSPDTPGLDSDGSERATESDSLLSVRESPILGVQTLGPRQIMIGKESAYQVAIRNTGKVAAERVVVTIDLPEWAEVVGADPSKGATDWRTARVEAGRLQWEVGQLAGGDEEKLALRIVPRQSRPFDLAVKWDYTPVVSQAMIEVQEPKLQMRLDGPSEVLFGQSQTYRLELANSGTGDAEDLEVSLAVVGAGQNVPATHKLARLAAGQKRLIEVELTARRAGTLTIQVDARGASGLEGHVAKEVTVKRPALELSVEAPELQYVGAEATYRICVSNPGTAAAQHVVVTAALPSGVRYLSNVGGGQVAPDQGKVTWTLESLGVGAKETVELRCRLAQAGLSRVEAGATAGGGLTASGDATVKVEAMADLALELDDPTGPVPVGSGATYQVRVHNRGTKSADEVEVVVYFSRGLEPVSAEGGRHQTAPGQVLFDKIPSLAAGQDATFRVKAEASEPGSHVCRVEVYCRPLGTRLVSEETTHFYGPTH